MKILFIHTDIHRYDPEDYGFQGFMRWKDMQFGISYISSYLERFDNKATLLFINRHSWEEDVLKCMDDFNPDIVGFGGVFTQFKHVLKIAQFIRKKSPEVYQVYGGIHATLGELNLRTLPFDAICKGEGERAILGLVDKLRSGESPREIANLIIKSNGKICSNPTEPFIQDLDRLPFPNRKMWEKYVDSGEFKKHVLLPSRGCPFECAHCSNKALKKVSGGNYVRFRNPNNVISELRYIKKEYPETEEVYFETETITTNLPWLEIVCEKLREFNSSLSKKMIFGANIRIVPNIDYNHIFNVFKKSNFLYVNIGIESGSGRIRKEVLNRNYSNQDIIDIFKAAKNRGIEPHAYNMIGLPGETPKDFRETIKINQICQPEDTHLSIFFPYPGTDLFNVCSEKGLLKKQNDFFEEREDAVLDTEDFPAKSVEKCYARFDLSVYRGKKNLLALLQKYFYKRYVVKKRTLLRGYLFLRKLIGTFFRMGKPQIQARNL